MRKSTALIGALGMSGLALGLLVDGSSSSPQSAYIDPSDQALVTAGRQIYANHCAACHGAKLEGQPSWRMRRADGRLPAPPHDETGHTWHHPDTVLMDIIKNGLVPGKTAPPGYISDMPAYGGQLGDHEIAAVLAYIKSSWPPQVRADQKQITLQPPQ
nr:cytochrome c [Castellaniella sp.]